MPESYNFQANLVRKLPLRMRCDVTSCPSQVKPRPRRPKMAESASMENGQFLQYLDPRISALLLDIKPNEVASFSPS